jgi:hypothetical protein
MRKALAILAWSSLSLTLWPSPAHAAKHSMADLKALATSGSHDELLAHAKDIAPTKRDDGWKKMVETAAIASLEGVSEPMPAVFHADDLVQQFPHLKASRPYMDKRASVGVKGFEACYQRSYSGVNCTERFVTFVKADAGNSKLAVDAGNLVIRNQFPYVAVRVYRFAILDRKDPPTACGEPELQRAIEAAISSLLETDAIQKEALKMKAVCAAQKSAPKK